MHPRTIPNLSDGTFDLEVVKDYIRPLDDSHQPFTGLICVENTHNVCGGTVLPLDFLAEVRTPILETLILFKMTVPVPRLYFFIECYVLMTTTCMLEIYCLPDCVLLLY